MSDPGKWLTIKIPRSLKIAYDDTKSTFPNFTQFVQHAIRKEIGELGGRRK